MSFWIILLALLALLTLVGFSYLTTRLARFSLMRRLGKTRRGALGLSALILIAVMALLYATLGPMNLMVVFIHALLIWLIAEGIAALYRRLARRPRRYYAAGAAALIFTVVYLAAGYVCANHVWRTEYTLSTAKALPAGGLKIVMFSDLHAGTTLTDSEFEAQIARMNAENADIAVIVGDFVDDDSDRAEMEAACRALSALEARQGIYFVFGNHDAGYYDNARRGYQRDDLVRCLRENGVTVLEDETVILADSVALTGRADLQRGILGNARQPMAALAAEVDGGLYHIVLDHEPGDYDAEAAAGADLVLSGHTHGGQMIPINYVGEWTGVNDRTYGCERRENTHFIVSSGISDWALQFKTGCISEYVVINILPE